MNLIWFNGPSQSLLVDRVPPQSQEIGCNLIYQLRPVHHVCVYDWQMFDRIDRVGLFKRWCRSGIKHPDWREVSYPLRLQPHNSGVLALHLARQLKWDHAYIIGCDWGVSNASVFDYGKRNSRLKYTNSQKHVVRELKSSMDLTLVNDNVIDLELDRISSDRFLDLCSQ